MHLEFYQWDVTDGMRSPWISCSRGVKEFSGGGQVAQKLESIVQSVMGFGFDSSMKDVDHDALWCFRLWKHTARLRMRGSGRLFIEVTTSSDNFKTGELPDATSSPSAQKCPLPEVLLQPSLLGKGANRDEV